MELPDLDVTHVARAAAEVARGLVAGDDVACRGAASCSSTGSPSSSAPDPSPSDAARASRGRRAESR